MQLYRRPANAVNKSQYSSLLYFGFAIAGPDQVITLPTDSISLDGYASNDPDGTISEWLWTKISGPASFNMRLLYMSIMGYPTMQEAGVLVEL